MCVNLPRSTSLVHSVQQHSWLKEKAKLKQSPHAYIGCVTGNAAKWTRQKVCWYKMGHTRIRVCAIRLCSVKPEEVCDNESIRIFALRIWVSKMRSMWRTGLWYDVLCIFLFLQEIHKISTRPRFMTRCVCVFYAMHTVSVSKGAEGSCFWVFVLFNCCRFSLCLPFWKFVDDTRVFFSFSFCKLSGFTNLCGDFLPGTIRSAQFNIASAKNRRVLELRCHRNTSIEQNGSNLFVATVVKM